MREKTNTLINQLPPPTKDPTSNLREALDNWGTNKNSRETLIFKEVLEYETLKTIKSLGNNTSTAHDRLNAMFIKAGDDILSGPINHTINLSIKYSKFPARWKIGVLLPLHKGKGLDRKDPSSYRPISLLPVIGKIAERMIQPKIMSFMTKSKQLNQNHHAYRDGHSTTTALLQLSDKIFRGCNENKMTTLVTVDQSSAFDILNHTTLETKLKLYNWGDSALAWVRSYLNNRSDYLKIRTKSSRYRSIHHGVPQGSVLGPILYMVYVNEMPNIMNEKHCMNEVHTQDKDLFNDNCSQCGMIPTYVDDATMIISASSRFDTQVKITANLAKMKDFLTNNSLTMNVGKTELLKSMVQQKRRWVKGANLQLSVVKPDRTLKIIEPKESIRLLGANFNKDCTWRHHLDVGEKALLPALRSSIGVLAHIGKNIPKKSKLLFANGLIMSKIVYLIPMWGGLSLKDSKRIQALMNKTARLVTGRPRKSRMRQLMTECSWLYFCELVSFHSLLMLWKLTKNRTPLHLANEFTLSEDNFVNTSVTRTKIVRNSFRHSVTREWNLLSQELRDMNDFLKLKVALKRDIIGRRQQIIPRRPDIYWD